MKGPLESVAGAHLGQPGFFLYLIFRMELFPSFRSLLTNTLSRPDSPCVHLFLCAGVCLHECKHVPVLCLCVHLCVRGQVCMCVHMRPGVCSRVLTGMCKHKCSCVNI